MRFRTHILVVVALTFITLLGVSGCGQKGPLVPPKAIAAASIAHFIR